MKASLSAQLKMAFFGAGEDDHIFATRQSAAAPRDRRAKQYDAAVRDAAEFLRVRAHDFAQSAADRLADNTEAEDDGLYVVPDSATDAPEPIFASTETDNSATPSNHDNPDETTITSVPTAPEPVIAVEPLEILPRDRIRHRVPTV